MAFTRHAAVVRVTHWLTAICFFALLVTGVEIVISHPRFYWGESGNVNTTPLFQIPIPSSRKMVKTNYAFVLPDQNGWSRYVHFQSAWLVILVGLAYVAWGLWSGHVRQNLMPARETLRWRTIARHLRLERVAEGDSFSYNPVQRSAYLGVVFVLFPLVIWTGLALSPAFDAALPATVNLLGGRQSARTLHFFITGALLFFLVVHITMVAASGFIARTRAMITGTAALQPDNRLVEK